MSALKIGIVEDDLLIAESIFVALQQLGYAPIKPVRSYNDALKMVQAEKPDFMLIDIRINGAQDGIDLAETINKEFCIPFIFLTGNSDNATVNRAKLVKPGAYLLKPFTESDLFSSIEIAFNNFNSEAKTLVPAPLKKLEQFVFIKERDIFYKIVLADILYVESDNVYLNVHTTAKTYVVRNKLDNFLESYSHQNFVRVHRSYAINVTHLQSINSLAVKVGDREIPLNKSYKQELLAMVNALK
jgi:two-component system response regulator LytT